MRKIFIKLMPCCFVFSVACCGGTLQDALGEADYTKYKEDQARKTEVVLEKEG